LRRRVGIGYRVFDAGPAVMESPSAVRTRASPSVGRSRMTLILTVSVGGSSPGGATAGAYVAKSWVATESAATRSLSTTTARRRGRSVFVPTTLAPKTRVASEIRRFG